MVYNGTKVRSMLLCLYKVVLACLSTDWSHLCHGRFTDESVSANRALSPQSRSSTQQAPNPPQICIAEKPHGQPQGPLFHLSCLLGGEYIHRPDFTLNPRVAGPTIPEVEAPAPSTSNTGITCHTLGGTSNKAAPIRPLVAPYSTARYLPQGFFAGHRRSRYPVQNLQMAVRNLARNSVADKELKLY